MTDNELVEVMARALWEAGPEDISWDRIHGLPREDYYRMARAALAKLRELGVALPEGWRVHGPDEIPTASEWLEPRMNFLVTIERTHPEPGLTKPQEPGCAWTLEEDGYGSEYWETSCGNSFVFLEGTPSENRMRFCPYCGLRLGALDQPEDQP